MDDAISREEFAALLRRAGLAIPDANLDELYGAYGAIAANVARVRAAGAAEPAHVFRPVDDPTL